MAQLVRTVVEFQGDMVGFFKACAVLYPTETSRAIRHTAWRTMMQMKTEFLAEVPGGRHVPTMSFIQKRRVIDAFKKYGPGPNHSVRFLRAKGLAYGMSGGYTWPMGGKLAQAIKYRMGPGRIGEPPLTASIGWLDKAAARTGALFSRGQKTVVTPRMRGLFSRAGIVLSPSKRVIVQPPRPIMRYFYEGRRQWMAQILMERLRRNINPSAASTAAKFSRQIIRRVVV